MTAEAGVVEAETKAVAAEAQSDVRESAIQKIMAYGFGRAEAEAIVRGREGHPISIIKVKPTREYDDNTISLMQSAKPHYRDKLVTFESDVDRAAFITAQDKPSKRDSDYLKFVMNATGMTDGEVRQYGSDIRENMKGIYSQTDGKLMIVPNQMKHKGEQSGSRNIKGQAGSEVRTNVEGTVAGTGGTSAEAGGVLETPRVGVKNKGTRIVKSPKAVIAELALSENLQGDAEAIVDEIADAVRAQGVPEEGIDDVIDDIHNKSEIEPDVPIERLTEKAVNEYNLPEMEVIRTEEMETDLETFQTRSTDYGKESYDSMIKEGENPTRYWPIIGWIDPNTGKKYVAGGGHTRLKAAKNMKFPTVNVIWAKTKEEAVKLAERDNRRSARENMGEDVNLYTKMKERGDTKEDIRQVFRGREYQLADFAGLKPSGDFMEILNQYASGHDISQYPGLQAKARAIGRLRQKYPSKLTNAHEQQIFQWLYGARKENDKRTKNARFKALTSDSMIIQIEAQITAEGWNPESALRLEENPPDMKEARVRSDTADIMEKIDKLRLMQDDAIAIGATATQIEIARELEKLITGVRKVIASQHDLFHEKSDTISLFASIHDMLNDDAGFIDSELLGSKLIVLAVQKIRSVAIKFAEWSSQMVAEFGIKIKPYLASAWKQAQLMIKDSDIDLIVTTSQAKKDLDGYSDRIDWVLDGIELDDADKEGLRLDVEYLKQLAKKRQGANFENQMDALKSVVVSPRGILKKLTAGKLFYKFVDYTHQSIGVIAGRPIKMLDAASDKLSSRDQIAMINRFKSWYERGAPDEEWVTQEIREWEKTYSAVMQYLGNLGDTAKILVRVKVRVGTIIAQQMHKLKELEQRRDRGEEGLNRAIRGARQSMDYWKKQSQAGIKYTNDSIYEPLGKHLRKNYFTHMLTGDARTVLINGRGEAFEAIQKMCIETGISIDDLRQASDPMSFNEDKKNSAMEEMRTANLPERLKYGKGKSLHLLETNPFTVANYYVMGAARRIATATAIRSVAGYDATIYPHYRTAINQFIEDLQAGVLAEGGGAANVNLMMGVWHNLMNSRLQSKDAGGHLSNALRPLKPIYRASESIARTAMLTMSNITNAIGGWYPIMANRGIANTLKGLVFTGTEKLGHVKAKQMLGFSMDMMGYQKNMLSHLGETSGLDQKTAELAKDTLRGLGFEMANRTLNKAASIAAIYWLDEIVTKMRRGHKNSLFYRSVLKKELQYNDSQIDRMIIDGVTAKDLALIIQQTVEMANVYRENPGNVPPWMKTEMGVTVMALNSFNRKMGQNLANGIWEAMQGNPRKLATLLLGGYVSQTAIIALKNMLNDRDDDDEWWVKGYMTMLGSGSLGLQGAYASDLAWAYRLDMDTMETLTTLAMPPTWGWMADFTGDFANAIIKLDKKHFDKLSKDVPIFKMIAANSYRMIEGKWHTDYNTYRKRGSRKKRSGDMVKNIRRGSKLTQGNQP